MTEIDPTDALDLIEQLEKDIALYKPVLRRYAEGEADQEDVVMALEETEVLKKL